MSLVVRPSVGLIASAANQHIARALDKADRLIQAGNWRDAITALKRAAAIAGLAGRDELRKGLEAVWLGFDTWEGLDPATVEFWDRIRAGEIG